jgi:hypothetical protein
MGDGSCRCPDTEPSVVEQLLDAAFSRDYDALQQILLIVEPSAASAPVCTGAAIPAAAACQPPPEVVAAVRHPCSLHHGLTPLHAAVMSGFLPGVQMLLAAGAAGTRLQRSGVSAAHLPQQRTHTPCDASAHHGSHSMLFEPPCSGCTCWRRGCHPKSGASTVPARPARSQPLLAGGPARRRDAPCPGHCSADGSAAAPAGRL